MSRSAIPLLLLATATAEAQQPSLYRAEFVQAAPGRLLELVEFYRAGLSGPERERRWRGLVTWHEELYVRGPSLDAVTGVFEGMGLAHIEVFQALAGHYDALRTEREMEAAFNEYVGRTTLLLFERDPLLGGAPWDMFTIDTYRDLRHYAEASAFSAEAGDAAARRAGFESSAAIGPTMRRHISLHHDTIGGIVR